MEQETSLSTPQPPSAQPVKAVKSKNRKIGLYLIIGPFVGVIVALIGLVVLRATSAMIGMDSNVPSIGNIIVSIINWLLALLGILSIVGFVIGIPLGIAFLSKREIIEGAIYDERSGNGEASVVPEEIKGWNWGAAGLTWIWGISHGVWISLLVFIPFVNIVMWIALGLKGSEWAWKKQKWESVERFVSHEKKWKPWGIIFLLLSVLGMLSSLLRGK